MVLVSIGMSLIRNKSVRQLVNKLQIELPQEVSYVARSAITQVKKKS